MHQQVLRPGAFLFFSGWDLSCGPSKEWLRLLPTDTCFSGALRPRRVGICGLLPGPDCVGGTGAGGTGEVTLPG